jgi:hypothetical protein
MAKKASASTDKKPKPGNGSKGKSAESGASGEQQTKVCQYVHTQLQEIAIDGCFGRERLG